MIHRTRFLQIFSMLALGFCSLAAQAQTYVEQTLHTFQGTPTDGDYCSGTLINVNGILYGITSYGGANGQGTVLTFDPSTNTEKVIHDFQGGPSHGTITFHTDGSFIYVPNAGYLGTDSFTYKDTNAIGTSNTATCTITVQ